MQCHEPVVCFNYSRSGDGEVLREVFACNCECCNRVRLFDLIYLYLANKKLRILTLFFYFIGWKQLKPVCYTSFTSHDLTYEAGCRCEEGETAIHNNVSIPAPTPVLVFETPEPTPESREERVADCVETAWLQEHGHNDGILRERGNSRVLCIPGLPCGTAGHMVRHCDRQSPASCKLRTYAEICSRRDDCTYGFKAVSRLRNKYDWNAVKSVDGDGTSIQLTSVSVSPESRRFSTSYAIAHAADWLGGLGLGSVCDYVLEGILWMNGQEKNFWKYVQAIRSVQSISQQ
ncbi:hypothetical protein FGB62_10g18 [Gracilaria domingensis]|nr:hypothetical protein FGB62_10g18 [Gracilaria domingensis]